MRIRFSSGLCVPVLLTALAVSSAGAALAAGPSAHPHEHKHQAESHEEHGAHVHGQGQLMLATEGQSLEVMLELTAADLLGFEHAPATDTEQQSWQRLQQQLTAGGWLELPAKASCQLTGHQLTDPWAAGQRGHSDISLTLQLQCQAPEALQQIDFKALFSLAAGLEQLSVQWVHQDGQGAATLRPAASLLQLKAG